MRLVQEGNLEGEFQGWDGETVFRFDNGNSWKQAVYRYRYFYKYRPHAKIWEHRGEHLLEVDGDREMLPVRRVY
jgi:hypothetical protein